MRISRVFPAIIAVAFFSSIAAQAQNVALVLSNGNYENGANVANITRQHSAMVSAFESQGYDVIEGVNLNRLQTRQLSNQFVDKLGRADIAVISLQGHVAHFGERSWFLPVDIDASSVTDVEFRAVSLDFYTQLLALKPGRSVMLVGESGRMNFRVPMLQEGSARMQIPRGVMMISGGFAEVGSLVRDRFMRRGARVSDVLRGNIGNLDIEGDVPSSLVLASGGMVDVMDTPEQIEAALRLSRDGRRNIQQDLSDLGFDTRGVDGVFGAATRSAIRNWQARERFVRNGFLTADQVALLRQQGNEVRANTQTSDRRFWAQTGADGSEQGLRQYLQRYPNGLFANRARAELARYHVQTDEEAWAHTVAINTPAAYRQYLEVFPNGIYKDIARARIGISPEVVENDAKRVEDSLRMNSITRLLIEQRVSELGYRTGPRDGNFDPTTRQGFRAYQRDRGMEVTGYVSADMIRRLLLNQ